MDTTFKKINFSTVAIVILFLLLSGCAGNQAKPDNCYVKILNHKASLEWNLYFWDADCDNQCDGATLEFINPGPGELGGVPLTCDQAWDFWKSYKERQEYFGA